MFGRTCQAVGALAWMVLVADAAYAQGSIVGVARDTSGAVLPGVTVEAASPALIEKVRSVVTDGTRQYQIVSLVPGAYTVTFMLPGFNTVRRDGIELTGSFTAKVDVQMPVGALEETITVTGAAPVVDVQSARQQRVVDREILDTIPAGRSALDYATLIPGVTSATDTLLDTGSGKSPTAALTTTNVVKLHSRLRHALSGQPGRGCAVLAVCLR